MLALARLTLRSPYHAATVVGLLAVLAVFIPSLVPAASFGVVFGATCMILSCILVGLIILTQGTVSGLQAIGVAIAGITLVGWISIGRPELGLWTALVQWTPIILLAQTLRSTNSLALTLLLGLALGAIGVAAQYLVWTDLEREWLALAMQRMEQVQPLDQQAVERNLQLVRLFVLALVATAYLLFIVVVLIARYLQAGLAGSKGFAEEFRALSLGKPAAAVALVLMLASFWVQQAWLGSLVFMIVLAFMFQGIAVVHAKLAPRRQSGIWLGLFYALLLIFPQVVALTAITGMIDNWIVFRRGPATGNDENGQD